MLDGVRFAATFMLLRSFTIDATTASVLMPSNYSFFDPKAGVELDIFWVSGGDSPPPLRLRPVVSDELWCQSLRGCRRDSRGEHCNDTLAVRGYALANHVWR
jgi:hypothetical protein